ncbi:hypothetical protein C4559_04230 [Candidatus Microgenomates bacterium]|nr:MAG: hypothetical protein C4559_04230 [Candidatus Microgenomates bacterium]
MAERISPFFQRKEDLPVPKRTKLSMIIDPPKQPPKVTAERIEKFLQKGGSAVLIGGSGFIEPDNFDRTVEAVTQVTSASSDVPVWILPGHLKQIPKGNKGVAGVLNYVHILGSQGDFENTYPKRTREYVAGILEQRQIPSIRTLYILCGDPNASVSQISGILPLDLSSSQAKAVLLDGVGHWLKNGINCVFFEAGSNSLEPANNGAVVQVRQIIDIISPSTLLIVSGGIGTPGQAKLFAGVADYVNIGGHFEGNGALDTADFVRALN